jgi:hypothetical protein
MNLALSENFFAVMAWESYLLQNFIKVKFYLTVKRELQETVTLTYVPHMSVTGT